MILTGELAPLGLAHRETEFIVAPVGPVRGQRVYGACGVDALGSAATAALQKLITTEQVYALMQPHGLCDAQGVTNDGKIATAATMAGGLGLTIVERHPYSGDSWPGWATFLGWHLGARDHPTVIELANGQALRDELSGNGENASGLRYHFICLLKRHSGGVSAYAGGRTLPSGYWACDGDNFVGGNNRANNFNAADVLQFYADATLAAALPCAAIAFAREAASGNTGASTGGSSTMWHQVSASPLVMADTNGVQAHEGMAAKLQANPTFGDVVSGCSGETYIDHATSILPLQGDVSLVYTASDSTVHTDQTGAVLWRVYQQLAAANAEIQALKNAPTPAPQQVPAPLTPAQQNDLAVMTAIRAALASADVG